MFNPIGGADQHRAGGSSIAISVLFFLSPLVTALSPRVAWLPLVALPLALIIVWRHDWRELWRPSAALLALVAVASYALLSAIWAADVDAAIAKSALLLVATLLAFAGTIAVTGLDESQLKRAATAFAAGAFVAGSLVALALIAWRALGGGLLDPFTKLFDLNGLTAAQTLFERPSELRRNVAILTFQLWPTLLILSVWAGSRLNLISGVFVFLTVIAVFLSDRMTSQVALIGSIVAFALASYHPRVMVRACVVVWCLAFILVLPMTLLAYRAELHMAPWLPANAQARVILWHYAAEQVVRDPWSGVGADSTPALNKERKAADPPEGRVSARGTGHHSHNLFLQVWYELGIFGAALSALAGALLALRIDRLPFQAQAFGVATFTTFVANVTFAWGMWQTWLVCGVALMGLYLVLASRATQARSAALPGAPTAWPR